MYNKNYLSKRPFLIITNRYFPAQGAQTQQKDWMEKSGWQTHEEVSVVDRITSKHLTMSTVIIDVMEAKLVKSNYTETPSDEILSHFMNKYKSKLQEAIDIWMERLARNKAMDELNNPTEDTAQPAD